MLSKLFYYTALIYACIITLNFHYKCMSVCEGQLKWFSVKCMSQMLYNLCCVCDVVQGTRCSSSCVSSVWSSCTGIITSLCCSTAGTHIKTVWPAAAGSCPWTTPSMHSCTATTRLERPALVCRDPSPCWSHSCRSHRWSWGWAFWRSSIAGTTTSTASPPCTTSSTPLWCTSATCCSSPSSSISPTSNALETRREWNESEKNSSLPSTSVLFI